MPTLGVHFPDDEAPSVEAAAKAAGQKLAPYIADAVRSRMQREGMLPGSPEAEALAGARDLIAAIGAERFRKTIAEIAKLREARRHVARSQALDAHLAGVVV